MKEYLFCVVAVIVFLASLVCIFSFFVGGIMLVCGINFPLWLVVAGGIISVLELAYVLYKG